MKFDTPLISCENIKMPVSRSAGIIFFRNTPEGKRYLILRASRSDLVKKEFWDIPKGELKGKETGVEAARREAEEETGLKDFSLILDFKHTARYFTRREGKSVPKFVAVFLAEVKTDNIKLSWEHDSYKWASFEEASEKLTTMKEALKKADEFLKKSLPA